MDKQQVSYPSPFPPPYQFPEPQQHEHTGEIPNSNAYETLVPDPSAFPPPQQLTEAQQQYPPPTAPPYLPPTGFQPMTAYPPQGAYYIAAPLPQQPNHLQQQQVKTCIPMT